MYGSKAKDLEIIKTLPSRSKVIAPKG